MPLGQRGGHTPTEAMCYLLDCHPWNKTQGGANQGYPKNPLNDAVKEEKGCILARDKSWMDQAEKSIQHVCGLADLKQIRDWQKRPVEFKP